MFAATVALALFVTRLLGMGALHVQPSPYHPVHHAFSDYAVGPTRRLATALSVLTAIGWGALSLAVWQLTSTWSYHGPATGILATLAALSVAVSRAPTDLEGERMTLRGRLHYAIAIASFGLSYSLTGDISRFVTAQDWGALGQGLVVLHWIALVGLAASCVTLVVPPARRVFGLVERVFLFAIALFYAAFAAGLLFA